MTKLIPSEDTRRAILNELRVEGVNWAGAVDDVTFLEAVWDLTALPSHDGRFDNAGADIWQHRIGNFDWPDDWIFSDSRFDLLHCDTGQFFGFLCRMVDPAVRRDPDEAERLVRFFNECLADDGWHLVVAKRLPTLDGRFRNAYAAKQRRGSPPPLDLPRFGRISDLAGLEEHLNRIEAGVEGDPGLAIGSAKELVESLCKQVLADFGEPYDESDEILDLYKKVAAILRLNAEAVPASTRGSQSAQRTLRALVTTIQSLDELRNALGIGHGRTTRSPALARHARLAATAARAITEFVLETWHVRRVREEPGPRGQQTNASLGLPVKGEARFQVGDHVTHPSFGSGVVIQATLTRFDEELVVRFDRAGVKILSGTLAPLSTIGPK